MTGPAPPMTAQGWPAPLEPLVGGPRDRLQAGALPTDVDRFRQLVWQPLASADPSGRRWLAALGGFELLRHGAAEPNGVLHATGRSIAAMLGIAETTWCRSTRQGQAGYGPLLEAAGLLVREDWERYRLPAWEDLQNRAPDATLRGRFVYTHRPTFRDTAVRWRLAGVSLAALGAWSLLRYCHTRWDTAELPLCDAAIARELGVKPHTWAGWAGELAGCGALQRLRPTPGAGWRLPLYFVLRTGRGLPEALAATTGGSADHAGTAVQLHATSADPHAEAAAGLSEVRAREDPVGDGGDQENPGGDVERTLERLAAAAGDAYQQQQVRTSTTVRARCAELLERTGWSPQRLAAELTSRELRTAREPVRVLAHRARILLDATAASGKPARGLEAATAPEDSNDRAEAAGDGSGPETPAGELDALDDQARPRLLEAARVRLRRIGLSRAGDFPDDHPLLRGEALNLLRQERTSAAQPGEDCAAEATASRESPKPVDSRQAAQPERPSSPMSGHRVSHRSRKPRRAPEHARPRPRRSRLQATAPATWRRRAPRAATRPRSRDPPKPDTATRRVAGARLPPKPRDAAAAGAMRHMVRGIPCHVVWP